MTTPKKRIAKGNQRSEPNFRRTVRAKFGKSQKRNVLTRVRLTSNSMRRALGSRMAYVRCIRVIESHRSAQPSHRETTQMRRANPAQALRSRPADLASRWSLQSEAQVTSQHFASLQRPLRRIGILIANLLQHACPLHGRSLDRWPSREGRSLGTPRAVGSAARGRWDFLRSDGAI